MTPSVTPVSTLAADQLFRDRHTHSGTRVVVWKDGEILWNLALGTNWDGTPIPLSGLSLWLSSSKPIAAILIARAWEQGELALDDAVTKFLPEFAAGGKDGITLRHLLTHTSGIRLPRLPWPEGSWAETIAAITASRLEPRWKPGLDAGYHMASSWFVLAEVLRRLDGRSFDVRVREDLFLPLGATSSWIGIPEERWEEVERRLIPMVDTSSDPPSPLAALERGRLVACNPGANGVGPLDELVRIWELLRRGGELDGTRILSPQTTEALLARHRVGQMDRTFRVALDWGLGVIPNSAREPADAANLPYHYGPSASPRAVGHSGARSSVVFCDRDHAVTIGVWWNGAAADGVHRERTNAVLSAIYADLGIAAAPAL